MYNLKDKDIIKIGRAYNDIKYIINYELIAKMELFAYMRNRDVFVKRSFWDRLFNRKIDISASELIAFMNNCAEEYEIKINESKRKKNIGKIAY